MSARDARRRASHVERDQQATTEPAGPTEQTIELREEEFVVDRNVEDLGDVHIRKVVDDDPVRLEVEARSEEVEVEHIPVGQPVSERREPWEEDDVLIVPVYEEQLVVTKRLVLREQIRIRRVGATRRELFEDSVRRERIVIEDPHRTGVVHERYPTEDPSPEPEHQTGNLVTNLVRKALE